METIFKTRSYSLAILCMFSALIACTDDNYLLNYTGNPDGTWKVSSFIGNRDQTSNFSGYTFQFNSGRQLKVTNGSNNVNGTWSLASPIMAINSGTTLLFDNLATTG